MKELLDLLDAQRGPAVARLVKQTVPDVHVIAYHEVGDHLQVEVIDSLHPVPTHQPDVSDPNAPLARLG